MRLLLLRFNLPQRLNLAVITHGGSSRAKGATSQEVQSTSASRAWSNGLAQFYLHVFTGT